MRQFHVGETSGVYTTSQLQQVEMWLGQGDFDFWNSSCACFHYLIKLSFQAAAGNVKHVVALDTQGSNSAQLISTGAAKEMCTTVLSARKINANQSLGGMLSPGRFCSEVCYNSTFSEHEQASDIVDWISSKRAKFTMLGVGVSEETLRKHHGIHWHPTSFLTQGISLHDFSKLSVTQG